MRSLVGSLGYKESDTAPEQLTLITQISKPRLLLGIRESFHNGKEVKSLRPHNTPKHSTSSSLLKRNESCLYEDLYMNIHFIFNSPKLEITQMSIDK